MDIVGPLPPAPGGVLFVLLVTDYFTKWVEASAYSSISRKEVTKFLKSNIISRFGLPWSLVEAILSTETTLPSLRPKLAQLAENNASLALDKDLERGQCWKYGGKVGKTVQTIKVLGKGAYKLQTLDGKKVPTAWNVIHFKKFYA
ncbi:hypothetical protein WN944_018884 [Citrus x changshan-huyou]|uniref:Integrase catalytic domain-containing protein n=1 Tax=Citrus x changshan-huyou TaxID=2935761 RepID=A0AAP0QFA2_9ROSI